MDGRSAGPNAAVQILTVTGNTHNLFFEGFELKKPAKQAKA
jgi:hypothetical protein